MSSNLVAPKKRLAKAADKAIRDHGKTEPNRLEDKRYYLSQAQAMLEQHANAIEVERDTLKHSGDTNKGLFMQMTLTAINLRGQAAVIAGLGTVVDCLSEQIAVKSKKTGKRGYLRYSLMRAFEEMSYDDVETMRRMMKKKFFPDDPEFADQDQDDDVIEDEMREADEK